MPEEERMLDVDFLHVDGLRYDPAWKTPGVLSAMRANTVDRIRVALPLGREFPIYFVVGYNDEQMPECWITLSGRVRDELMEQLPLGCVHELRNSQLWALLKEKRNADNASIPAGLPE